MTEFEHLLRQTPTDLLGETPYDEEELANLRQKAWRTQGVFIISILDEILSETERLALARMADKIFGSEDRHE